MSYDRVPITEGRTVYPVASTFSTNKTYPALATLVAPNTIQP